MAGTAPDLNVRLTNISATAEKGPGHTDQGKAANSQVVPQEVPMEPSPVRTGETKLHGAGKLCG